MCRCRNSTTRASTAATEVAVVKRLTGSEVITMGWLGALAGIGGLLAGGLGAASTARQQSQSNAALTGAQNQNAALYSQALAANTASLADAQSRITAGDATVAGATSAAKAMLGTNQSTALRKNDGNQAVKTSLWGDPNAPNTARNRLLGN